MENTAEIRTSSAEVAEEIQVELHDMCQPLTVLRCRLELGLLFGEPAAMREALEDGLAACMRLSGSVARLRNLVENPPKIASNGEGGLL